jgi:hypothetical protein
MPPYSASLAVFVLALLGAGLSARVAAAQGPAPNPAPAAYSIGSLRPALANVQTAIGDLSVGRWKVPGGTRTNVQQDVTSMQRDLINTLPGLMSDAEVAAATAPGTLSPAFAVFRNVDALYDVLLRVTETAAVAGAGADATNLEAARAALESSRAQLGAWLTQAIATQDVHLTHPPPPPAVAAAPAPPSKVVVNDGPEAPRPRKKKATPAPQ